MHSAVVTRHRYNGIRVFPTYKAVHITSTSRTSPAAIEDIDSSEWLTVRMTANLNSELGESSTDVSHDNLLLESVFITPRAKLEAVQLELP